MPTPRQVSIPDFHNAIQACFLQILAITTAHDACITGDLSTVEELLTQEIDTNTDVYTSYVHRSFIRKHTWDHALQDAIKVSHIHSSQLH
jgi:hypothetical protein